ncbi:MAG: hypothetical protein AAGI03_01895 [Pseudomonadota bacterium]
MASDLFPIPERCSDDERRLREALNRQCERFLHTVDSALRLRTAPSEVKRARALVRTSLINAGLNAIYGQDLLSAETTEETSDEHRQ